MTNSVGLDFPKYLVPLHALHLLNIWMVWLLIRKLGLGPLAATAGAFFFGFHAALIDAWWKPMFVFDLLCGTFSLAAFLLYVYDRWILSLIAFWLAYKSKELAIMLPVALACYELWFGGKRWKRLVPFFAISLLFGVQVLILRPGQGQYETETRMGTAGDYPGLLRITAFLCTLRGPAAAGAAVGDSQPASLVGCSDHVRIPSAASSAAGTIIRRLLVRASRRRGNSGGEPGRNPPRRGGDSGLAGTVDALGLRSLPRSAAAE